MSETSVAYKSLPHQADQADAENRQPARKRPRSRKAVFLTWLRKTHLYVGLWGAVLGLLFGATGILLNHRAIMKIPVEKTRQHTVQLQVPQQGFASPADMSAWLQRELGFSPVSPPVMRSHAGQTFLFNEREVAQPQRWTVSMNRPDGGLSAEYFVGNRFMKVDQTDATPIGTLVRLHMAVGVNAFWVLLSDTIAAGMIVLSITGLLLWTQLHTVRTAATLASIGALLLGVWFMWTV